MLPSRSGRGCSTRLSYRLIAFAMGLLSLVGVSVVAAAPVGQDPGSTPADIAAAQRVIAERQARQIQLQSPDMRAERSRRRTAYRGVSDSDAVDRTRRDYPRLLDEPPYPGAQFRSGANVEYLSDRVARVRQAGRDRDSLAMSALPLRAPDETGHRVPVDLGLTETSRGFAPKVPLVEASFGGRLSDGFSVGSDPLRLTLSHSADRPAQRVGDRLFYANVQPDTDLVAFPTPTGIELVSMLRSIDSRSGRCSASSSRPVQVPGRAAAAISRSAAAMS